MALADPRLRPGQGKRKHHADTGYFSPAAATTKKRKLNNDNEWYSSTDEQENDGKIKCQVIRGPLSPPNLSYPCSSSSASEDEHHIDKINKPQQQQQQQQARKKKANRRTSSFSRRLSGYQSGSSSRKRRSITVPQQDQIARQRCFDYLVSAIDQVWAQYCDCTSNAESEIYSEDQELAVKDSERPMTDGGPSDRLEAPAVYEHEVFPCSPVSLCGSELDEEADQSEQEAEESSSRPAMRQRQGSVLQQPKSINLMNIKRRLLNAKYFFDNLLDSIEPEDSAEFWHRWDLVKYTAIELVEEADDDEVIEEVTQDLERGRYFSRG